MVKDRKRSSGSVASHNIAAMLKKKKVAESASSAPPSISSQTSSSTPELIENHSSSELGDIRSPSELGDNRSPSELGDNRSPSELGDKRSPSELGDNRSPSQLDDNRSPMEFRDIRSPSHPQSGEMKGKFQTPEVGETPNQPKQYTFPPRKFGNKTVVERRFKKEWFEKYTWLHYDELNDRAFCHTCVCAYNMGHMTSANDTLEQTFISTGYTNWKDALVKKRGFAAHEQSKCHQHAVLCTVTLPRTTADVGELLNETLAKEKSIAREVLLKILSNIRFLARQALPMRGDGVGEPNSNFNQLYQLRGEDNPFMKEWIARKGSTYTHHDMQNEMLKVMALKVLREISSDIRNAEFYSIMADETADVSNTEQLVLCIRWVDDDLQSREEFIGLHAIDTTDANTIVLVIKDVLLRMNLSISRCRGQCYDGCSTMKGDKNGVAKQIKDIERRALLTHCYTHSLNLAVGDAIKKSKIMKDALETTHEITKLIKKSPKRDTKLEKLKKEAEIENSDQGKIETITLLCPTRWTVRAKSLGSIVSNFNFLEELWEWSLDNCTDTDMKARIRGVDTYMKTFDFVYGVYLGELILTHSDNLSRALQDPTLSAVEGQDIAKKTVAVLEKIRSDESFDLFWTNVTSKSEALGANEPTLPRKRKQPKKLTDYVGYGPAKAAHPEDPKELYRKHYYEAVDLAINCIKDRFNQKDFRTYAILQELLLKAAKNEPFEEELKEVIEFYEGDFDASLLRSQLSIFAEDIPDIKDINFSDVLNYLRGLGPGMKRLISEVIRVAKLIVVCPATNATSERSFSALRRAKSYLQSTMKQLRLNNIMILHLHKDRTDDLNLTEVANEFVSVKEQRKAVFGNFVPAV